MNVQDEFENFEAAMEGHETAYDFFEAGWKAALGQQEPVACIGTNGELMWLNKPNALYSKAVPLYTHPAPAVAVNEQLLEALKAFANLDLTAPIGAIVHEDFGMDVLRARSAIAAAEAAKGGL